MARACSSSCCGYRILGEVLCWHQIETQFACITFIVALFSRFDAKVCRFPVLTVKASPRRLVAHIKPSLEEKHTILPMDRASPEVSATNGKRCARCVHENLLLLHTFHLSSGETKGSLGCTQHHSALAFAGIVDKLVDDDPSILA